MDISHTIDVLKVRSLRDLLAGAQGQPALLLEPWLRERDLNMTYAPTGVGKSLLTMSIALAVAGGGELLGWRAPAPRRVLIVDGEMDVADLQERAAMLLDGLSGIDREAALGNLMLCAYQDQPDGTRFPDVAHEADRERVLALVRKHKPALVILDNYSTLATVDDENDASSFNPGMELLRELKRQGCAVILVHHARKGQAGTGGYRGTSKMGVLFNHIIALAPADDAGLRQGASFRLAWEKYRGKPDERIGAIEATLRGTMGWTYERDERGRLEAMKAKITSGRYATVEELASELGCSKGQASKLCTKAVEAGVMTREEYLGGLQRGKARRDDAARLGQEDDKEDY